MKWKRKGGCLRAQEGAFQVKIEGPGEDGTVFLSFKGSDGAWYEPRAMQSVDAAKLCAEDLREAYVNVTTHNAELVARRRAMAAEDAAADPQEKSIRKLFDLWRGFGPFERAQARRLRPDLADVFDAYDRVLIEIEADRMQHEAHSEEANSSSQATPAQEENHG